MIDWFNSREAAQIGASLADAFSRPSSPTTTPRGKNVPANHSNALTDLLRRADREVRSLGLNFYKKAKFANSFKWRLIENGVARDVADEVTESLVLHLSQDQSAPEPEDDPATPQKRRPDPVKVGDLFKRGNKCLSQGAYAEAVPFFEELIELDSSHAEATNNLGAALAQLSRYTEAEHCFRLAIAIKPTSPDAHCNLGTLLRSRSDLIGSEASLRRALKLKPNYLDARTSLGLTLAFLGRLRDAKACFAKVLKAAPRNAEALYGIGQIAKLEGRFEDAETTWKLVLEVSPKMPSAWAGLASIRKMTRADADWLQGAKKIAESGIAPLEEANLRFAIGKHYDDIDDFEQAFSNYQRANELLKTMAEDYDREERTRLADDFIRVYDSKSVSKLNENGSDSVKPVFVVGMPRSGTSLAEQIIASHSAASGAGELTFWNEALITHERDVRRGIMDGSARQELAESYLRVLADHSAKALRVVDKAPTNSDYLGLIYSVFPNARVIYMQRDPIDTCLSCYFQQFLVGLNFTMDLSDLAHYYRGHQRLMAHWRAALPPGFILDVPYEELVSDPEAWTRKILQFIGLEWDANCLEFHRNKRQVTTASAWQVRQKIYKNSVARWRNYEKFVGPLKGLRE